MPGEKHRQPHLKRHEIIHLSSERNGMKWIERLSAVHAPVRFGDVYLNERIFEVMLREKYLSEFYINLRNIDTTSLSYCQN